MSKEAITRRDLIKNLVGSAVTLHGATFLYLRLGEYASKSFALNNRLNKIEATTKSAIDKQIAEAEYNPSLSRSADGAAIAGLEIALGLKIIPK